MSAPVRVAVVGAGPGGMAAAAVAAESGCKVLLIDENPAAGGQIWRGAAGFGAHASPHRREYAKWARRLLASGAEFWPDTTVVDRPAVGTLRVEREGRWQDLAFDRLILATGARERFLPFPGWTLPGVMGTGGLQAVVKSGLPVSGSRVVVAGSGPLLLAVAAGLARMGANVEGIFEQAPLVRLAQFGSTLVAHPGKLIEGAGYRWATRGSPYRTGWWVTRALGRTRLESLVVSNGKSELELACAYLACGFHLVPNLELARMLGCRIEVGYVAVNALQETSEPGVYCVGEPTGIGGLEKALVEGEIAGLAAAGRGVETARLAPSQGRAQRRARRFARRLDKAFGLRSELRALATTETIVCRCEDVAYGALEGCADGRAGKLHTRCGMGPCQGRICGPATEFLFGWSAASVRPPVFPARVSTLGGDPDCAAETHASASCEMA
jgi:NADPH-dependent 2,4-dienoyl-CoA reductase/sulfur reductase-like enzyme